MGARAGHGEAALRARFAVREETFRHGAFSVGLVLPLSADALIDEADFAADERLPYWAELWPSARALARYLLEAEPADARPVLELGCGLALPSLALAWSGATVLATDWYPDALRFAEVNAARNGLAGFETAVLDWRAPMCGRRFPRVVAADVLYEPRNATLLAGVLERVAAPGARVLLADPGRVHAPAFLEGMGARGWAVEAVDERQEPSAAGARSRVRIWRLERRRREGRQSRQETPKTGTTGSVPTACTPCCPSSPLK
jgi:ETFB lysine methyltransferase